MNRSDTVELLNDTDDLERKLSWILFKQEISGIWDGEEGEWRPGDPMFKRPSGWIVGQQTIRFMVDDVSPKDDSGRAAAQIRPLYWCRDCQVGWELEEGTTRCWMCGSSDWTHERAFPLNSRSAWQPAEMIDFSEFLVGVERARERIDEFGTSLSRVPDRLRELIESQTIHLPHVSNAEEVLRWYRDESGQRQLLAYAAMDVAATTEQYRHRYLVHPRRSGRRGLRAQMAILDEWTDSLGEEEPGPTTVGVVADDGDLVSIELPADLDIPTRHIPVGDLGRVLPGVTEEMLDGEARTHHRMVQELNSM